MRDFQIDPVVRLHYVEVTPPELASPSGDLARLLDALEAEWGLTGLETDLHVVRALQPALEAGDYKVTVAVHDGRWLTGIWPGFHDRAFGVAIDVGSTTIAGHLADLDDGAVIASNGVMNPQIRFGEDLMSRVSYAMMHPEGAGEMTRAVRGALAKLVAGLCRPGRRARPRDPRAGRRRQPDHAPPPARDRPDPARFGAVCAGHRPIRPDDRGRARDQGPSGCAGVRPAVHRRSRRRGHGRSDPGRDAPSCRPDDPRRRRRHERRDRPRRPPPSPRRIEPDRAGLRRRPDQRRPARRAGSDRAGPDRPLDARAAVQDHRLRAVVGRARLRGRGQPSSA